MSYHFAIIGTQDNPLFEYEFGTSKQGGDGQARFSEQAHHLNQFVLHSSLDIVEEVQWTNGQLYLKVIDKFFTNYISCFITAGNVKFLLLHQPTATATAPGGGGSSTTTRSSTSVGANPTSPQTEEAIKNFFAEVYDNYVKAVMSPFYRVNMEIRSPVFRQRVAAAGRKYL
ncbi:transport protein particle 20 kDa subunit [Parachaetomium inaequale]|uniref:Transport protein particle 20 kDa subunit n=1 Tax=Parachaetomium inaequale TaxID=2588326 RepID=A0AAN6P4U2_9PEZI|nr:transport protein particle 20 kDa subunit [Parachaetomium inaequale]